MPITIKLLKWSAAFLVTLFAIYGLSVVVFLIGYHYASPKYERIGIGDTRADIEDSKGLLVSRAEDRSFLEGYQFVSPFEELVLNSENEIVSYSIGFAFFAVIYDKQGNFLAKIDNGLDG